MFHGLDRKWCGAWHTSSYGASSEIETHPLSRRGFHTVQRPGPPRSWLARALVENVPQIVKLHLCWEHSLFSSWRKYDGPE